MGICLLLRVVSSYVTESSQTRTRASRSAGHGRPAEGRLRLLAAAEQLFATRGLEVPNREIVATAGQHNQSAITYHFASRAGLIDAVCEQHEKPIALHRQHRVVALVRPGVPGGLNAAAEPQRLVDQHHLGQPGPVRRGAAEHLGRERLDMGLDQLASGPILGPRQPGDEVLPVQGDRLLMLLADRVDQPGPGREVIGDR